LASAGRPGQVCRSQPPHSPKCRQGDSYGRAREDSSTPPRHSLTHAPDATARPLGQRPRRTHESKPGTPRPRRQIGSGRVSSSLATAAPPESSSAPWARPSGSARASDRRAAVPARAVVRLRGRPIFPDQRGERAPATRSRPPGRDAPDPAQPATAPADVAPRTWTCSRSWRVREGFETLRLIEPAVSILGGSRVRSGSRHYRRPSRCPRRSPVRGSDHHGAGPGSWRPPNLGPRGGGRSIASTSDCLRARPTDTSTLW